MEIWDNKSLCFIPSDCVPFNFSIKFYYPQDGYESIHWWGMNGSIIQYEKTFSTRTVIEDESTPCDQSESRTSQQQRSTRQFINNTIHQWSEK